MSSSQSLPDRAIPTSESSSKSKCRTVDRRRHLVDGKPLYRYVWADSICGDKVRERAAVYDEVDQILAQGHSAAELVETLKRLREPPASHMLLPESIDSRDPVEELPANHPDFGIDKEFVRATEFEWEGLRIDKANLTVSYRGKATVFRSETGFLVFAFLVWCRADFNHAVPWKRVFDTVWRGCLGKMHRPKSSIGNVRSQIDHLKTYDALRDHPPLSHIISSISTVEKTGVWMDVSPTS